MVTIDGLIYALLWLSFGAGHSLLAAPGGRGWLERRAGAADRLAYNLIAVAHLAIVLGAGHLLLGGRAGYVLPAPLRAAMSVAAALGLAVLLLAGRAYDFGRFLGTTQLRRRAPDAAIAVEPLATGGINAWVRHPLYLGVLLILWGMVRSPFGLATAVWASLYIAIGIRYEERKLVRRYGAAYAAYRARVPMLLPWIR